MDNNFIEEGKLDKENFRIFIWENLIEIKEKLEKDFHSPFIKEVLQRVNDHCVVENDEICKNAVKEIINLNKNIENWITEAVENAQRFEFFILSKASEIASGNQDKDYYYAMMIRHDQLLAVVKVFQKMLSWWDELKSIDDLNLMVKSEYFKYFGENSSEKMIFREAELIYSNRKSNK